MESDGPPRYHPRLLPAASRPAPSDVQEDAVIRFPLPGSHRSFVAIVAGLIGVTVAGTALAQARRDFTVTARRYTYSVSGSDAPELHVMQHDLVHMTSSSDDIPRSSTIEEAPYRIMRRAEPGKPVSFSLRADQPGRFRFYCNLTADEGCREQQGTLVVTQGR